MQQIIFFSPPLRCFECGRQTTIARVSDTDDADYRVEPCCYLHCFIDWLGNAPSKQELPLVYGCVQRFVQRSFDDCGQCTVISLAHLDEVPGYRPSENPYGFTDRAFYCRWDDGQGDGIPVWVVWDMVALEFVLYK